MRTSIGASLCLSLAATVVACSDSATTGNKNSVLPSRIVGKFDGDSTVQVGTAYNVAQHFRLVVENSTGDSVGVSALTEFVSIVYVPTLANGKPGVCEVPPAGQFSVYCPASDFPTTGASLSYNGYWQAIVQGAPVNGLPDSSARGALHWHVVGVANSPISFAGKFDGDSTVAKDTAYNVAAHFHFIVEDAHGDSLTFSAVVNLPSIQWTLLAGQAPQTPPSCTVPTDTLTLNCPASSGPGFNGYYTVTVQEGSFNGIANPSYRGTMHLYVGPTSNVQLSFVGKFDGDSSVAIGTTYNVAQHFHFVVEDSSGDSVSSVPVVNLPSIQWVLQSGQAPPAGSEGCSVATDVLVLYCQSSDLPGTYTGYYVVTVQPGSFNGIANPAYRPTFDLNVTQPGTSPLTFVGAFDGDSLTAVGTPYSVTQHFHFIIADTQDSVNSVPVVNLPSIQWVLQSGQAPPSPPSCTVAADVLVLNCPASSGSGFTGFYVVTTQPGGFNGIANPSYRPTFDLYVSP